MELSDEKVAAISGVDDDELEEEEEVEEEIEEEVEEEVEEEEEEVEEEVEEVVEEEIRGGGDSGEGELVGESAEKKGTIMMSIDHCVDSAGQNGSSSSNSGKIFVGGVARETTADTFAKHFEKYGDITDSVIMKDKHTQKPRGFGFITFADPSVIDKVLEDEHVIDGRTVEVKRTVPREDMTPSRGGPKTKKIFVGGIPPSFTDDELKEHFSSYGKVAEHQIMVDHSTGRSRGFGFVTFESEETVDKIISEGKMHDLGGKRVEIKKAEPKKHGGEAISNVRAGYGAGSGNMYGFGGDAYGYAGGYRSGSFYGGRDGGYGRGYGYGAAAAYGAGFGPSFAGAMYGAGGYGAGNGYGGPYGYGGAYSSYGGGRGYGRYHPYGR